MSDSLGNLEFEVLLDKLVYGGEAMGRLPDGRAVFVPYALPGEQVRIRLIEEKRGYARGKLLDVVSPSKLRIEPVCKHFTICGGCHYQHFPYEAQLEAKTEIFRDQLIRIGDIDVPPVQDAVPSLEQHNYRNHIQFHMHPSGKLGFQKWRTNEVVEIDECFLPDDALTDLWKQIEIDSESSDRISLRVGSDDETMIVFSGDSSEPPAMNIDIPLSVVYGGPSGKRVLAGEGQLDIEILGRSFQVSADAFFQVNNAMTEKMVSHVLEQLPLDKETVIIDAYCGVGLFSAFLAPKVGQVIGIESAKAACDDFVENLKDFENVSLYQDEVENTLPVLDEPVDIILVDPPRAGLATKVVDAITQKNKPKVLVYISCDPATLSRDAKRLINGGYTLKHVTPFDMFPQTYHIESISLFERI